MKRRITRFAVLIVKQHGELQVHPIQVNLIILGGVIGTGLFDRCVGIGIDMTQTILPRLPSQLLRIALADLEKCESDPRFKVDMGVWLAPPGNEYLNPSTNCAVCLAGAVMANTLNVSFTGAKHEIMPSSDDYIDPKNQNQLMAIDLLRGGYLRSAFNELSIEKPKDIPDQVKFPRYGNPGFYVGIFNLIELLEANGY